MKISESVYKNLRPWERIIAVIEAESRDDAEEVQRLTKSCPKQHYTANESSFTDSIQRLYYLNIRIEYTLSRYREVLLLALVTNREEELNIILQEISNLRTGWEAALKELGIAAPSLQKVSATERSFLEDIPDFFPPSDPTVAESLKKSILKCILNKLDQ